MLLKKILAILISIFILNGCTAIQNNELTKVEKIPDVSMYENKPTAFIQLNLYQDEPQEISPRSIPYKKDEVHKFLRETIEATKLFSSITFDPSKKMEQDYTITLNVYNHGNHALAMLSGFITGFSFFIIPGAATDNYTLRVNAISNSSGLETMVQNKDSVTTWVGIWFLPMMANTPREATHNTIQNQIRDSLKQLFDKGSLKYSQNELFVQKEMIKS